MIFHPGHNPRDAVLVFRQQRYHSSTARLYGSDIHRAGVTLGIGSSRCAQGAPDGPSSLLLYKDKESASSSRCALLQRAVPALQARMQCWLVRGLPGGGKGGCTTTLMKIWGRNGTVPRENCASSGCKGQVPGERC